MSMSSWRSATGRIVAGQQLDRHSHGFGLAMAPKTKKPPNLGVAIAIYFHQSVFAESKPLPLFFQVLLDYI